MKKQKNKQKKINKRNSRGATAAVPQTAAAAPAEASGTGMDLMTALKTALEYQQADNLEKAEQYYRVALEIEPGNSIASQLLGRLAQMRGDNSEAVEFFRTALKSTPGNAELLNNLGNCLNALELHDDAIMQFEQALELEPGYAIAHNNLGAALTSVDRPEEAIEHIERSLKIRPDNAAAHNNLGNAYRNSGDFKKAVSQYNLALKIQPKFPEAYYNLGIAFEYEKLFDDAIVAYQNALELNPDYAEAYYNLGNIYMEIGSIADARKNNDKALELNSAYVHAQSSKGEKLQEKGTKLKLEKSRLSDSGSDPELSKAGGRRNQGLDKAKNFDEAISRFEQAIAAKPDFAEAHNNLGIVLSDAGRLEEAVTSFNRAISIAPGFAGAYANLGSALQQSGKLEEAEAECRRALELDPELADAHMNLAIISLMKGDVATGWKEYEWRSGIKRIISPRRSFPQPQWDGSSLDGKNILLWGDQGLGDEIRYASLIPDMLEKGAAVSVECTPRLVDLFARSFPQAIVHAYPFDDAESGKTAFDFQCSIPGLGRFLRPSVETFSRQLDAYLVPDTGRKKFWQERFSKAGSNPKIGINWRSTDTSERWKHYYATIDELAPVMSIPGVDFVNLMYDANDDELAEFKRLYGVTLLNWDDINLKDDLDDLAALNAGLDMVVSCLSSTSEMSGALGVRTLGFIGDRKDPVMLGTGNAIWHPDSKYFSKDRGESWQPVFEDIAQEIRKTFSL